MKVFETGDKVNFVDSNNVFVGYDLGQDCCEHAGWFIKPEPTAYSYEFEPVLEQAPDVEGYDFDPSYEKGDSGGDLDGGGMTIFRLTSGSLPDLYLHIFNAHNGYYCHGFEVKHGDVLVREGYL